MSAIVIEGGITIGGSITIGDAPIEVTYFVTENAVDFLISETGDNFIGEP
jgi:hypothetical protein